MDLFCFLCARVQASPVKSLFMISMSRVVHSTGFTGILSRFGPWRQCQARAVWSGALALVHPWTICGTPTKNEMRKDELAAEVAAFRAPVVLHHLSAMVNGGKNWLWVQSAGETSSGIHHPMTREQERAWVF